MTKPEEQKGKFRVVVEHFDTPEKAIAFRDKLCSENPHQLSYIQIEQERHDWRTWTFG